MDTFLRFAEATNRLDLYAKGKDLGDLAESVTKGGAKGKTSGALEGAVEKREKSSPRAGGAMMRTTRTTRKRSSRRRPSPAARRRVDGNDRDIRVRVGQSRRRTAAGTRRIGPWAESPHTHQRVAAIVSDVPTDRALGTRDDLIAHERVLDTVAERTAVLPMRFPAVVEEQGVVSELLALTRIGSSRARRDSRVWLNSR